jgi:hypothetical protein
MTAALAYYAPFAEFSKARLKELDTTVTKLAHRHPGKPHVGRMPTVAIEILLGIELPSTTLLKGRIKHVNRYELESRVLQEINVPQGSLPLPDIKINHLLHQRFVISKRHELARLPSARPFFHRNLALIDVIKRLRGSTRVFASAFVTDVLPFAARMHKLRLHADRLCPCDRKALANSLHYLVDHARGSVKRIQFRPLMSVTAGFLIRRSAVS